MAQALEGVKVLDLGNYIAGPYAAMLLGDQGAKVIKVERPEGDPYRKVPGFIALNRGKRSITVDLKRKQGQQIAQELAKRGDILIHNFRPGVAQELGVDYETLSRLNPRLIYCAITGYGEKGPYRDKLGWEPLVASLAGAYTDQPSSDGSPTFLVLPLASYFAAFLAAFSSVMALYIREITGRGQAIEMPLLNALTVAEASTLVDFEEVIRPQWAPQGQLPLYRLYQGGDGQWFCLGVGNYAFFTKFALALGHEEWFSDPLFEGAPWMILPPRSYEVQRMLKQIFATKTRDEWLEFLRSHDIPCAPARRIDEFLDDPQLKINEMVIALEDPHVGRVRQMGIPLKLSLTPGKVKGPSPLLGQHTQEILSELGYPPDKLSKLREGKVI